MENDVLNRDSGLLTRYDPPAPYFRAMIGSEIRAHQFSPEEALLEEILFESGPIKEIVLHNDDVNTFQHVIESLMDVCGHEPVQAEQCAHIVHYNGKCSVKRGSFDRLEPMCAALLERGLSADIA